METITQTYNLLWQLIIRPSRDVYSLSDLGPKRFTINGVKCERVDLQLTNDRGQTLECSHFRRRGATVPRSMPGAGMIGWLLGRGNGASPDGAGGGAVDKEGCVIYCHGNCSSRMEAIEVVPLLLPRNISVFCLDFSGSGRSDGEYISLGYHEQQDLRVAIDHLRGSGQFAAIGLWGRSMGAATSVLRAGEDPEIAACVLDSGFSSLPMVAQEIVNSGRVPVPRFVISLALQVVRREVSSRADFDIYDVLPIHSASRAVAPALFATAEDDTFVLPHHTKDLYDAWGGDERIFLTFDGGHNGERPDWFRETAAAFLEKHLAAYANGDRQQRREDVLRVPDTPATPAPALSARKREALLSSQGGQELKAMGFSDDAIVEALTRHAGVEAAVAWILDVSAQAKAQIANVDVQLTAPSTNRDLGGAGAVSDGIGAGPQDSSAKTRDSIVQNLVMCGYTEEQANQAARRCSSVEAAVEWLAANG
mmetsp:Transcript_140668/g.262464  ORF Transcript_140668/g.262464 Transcript_140668/m.262464 type:complete len:479 (+) Transcript_140668:97-1533(+)